jgi:hypothetical protein
VHAAYHCATLGSERDWLLSLRKSSTERKFNIARRMTAADFCVNSMTAIENEYGCLLLV